MSGMSVSVVVAGSLPSIPSRKNVGLGPLTLLASVPAVLPLILRQMPEANRTDQPAHSFSYRYRPELVVGRDGGCSSEPLRV